MNRKKKIAAGAAAVVIVIIAGITVFSGKKGGQQQSGGPGGAGGMGEQTDVTVVKAAVPYVGDLELTTSLTGTVEAADVVYVYAKAAGDVTSVQVKAGDTVKQGQVLCEIDTEQVDSAKNALDTAQVSLSEAQSNLSRMQILYNGGDLSDQEFEQYTNAVKSAQLQYESAQLTYNKQVEYSTVTAPISGRIESCDVEVFDRVSQSGQLCVIAGEGDNRVSFYVTERMMQNINEGDQLEIIKNGKSYAAYITEISSMVDTDTGLFKVKAGLEDTDEIATGSTVKLNLVTERATGAMLVPVNAIYYSGGDGYVYLYQDGIAKMVPVEVGLYDSESAEITSGLSTEDMVVQTWSSNLYEGAKIRLYEETEDTSADGNEQLPDGESTAAESDGVQPSSEAAAISE